MKPKGRGRGRGAHKQNTQTKRCRCGSGGSSTSPSSRPGGQAASATYHDIPSTARIQCASADDVLWVNQHQQVKPRRVIGEKVLIRQQPPAPPPTPQILILSDQMLKSFVQPDKYINCIAMVGYSLRDYVKDIQDELIKLDYPYIVFFVGTMQLGTFDSRALHKDIADLMKVIMEQSPNSLVVMSGLVLRPLDYLQSKMRCLNYNRAFQLSMQDL